MTLHVAPRKFTVEEYARMGEAGVFAPDERVELIEGEILPMTPQNRRHARVIEELTTLLVLAFAKTHYVRVQLPLTLGLQSEPEPDFAVVPKQVSLDSHRHPGGADLVLEISGATASGCSAARSAAAAVALISDSSLSYDRNEKASLYAKFGIAEYWILNLKNRRLEVRTRPEENAEAPFLWSYSETRLLSDEEAVEPGFAVGVSFSIKELLG